jgi:CheY-like chemotaxis protein
MAARRVLLIEDDAAARDGLGSLLAEDGYLVRTAPTGERGLVCAAEFRPDVVVCDFTLPGIDGLQVLRRLRDSQGPVFFIVLTAGCGDDELERALRHEADVFLRKPVDLQRFRAVLADGPDGRPRPPVCVTN